MNLASVPDECYKDLALEAFQIAYAICHKHGEEKRNKFRDAIWELFEEWKSARGVAGYSGILGKTYDEAFSDPNRMKAIKNMLPWETAGHFCACNPIDFYMYVCKEYGRKPTPRERVYELCFMVVLSFTYKNSTYWERMVEAIENINDTFKDILIEDAEILIEAGTVFAQELLDSQEKKIKRAEKFTQPNVDRGKKTQSKIMELYHHFSSKGYDRAKCVASIKNAPDMVAIYNDKGDKDEKDEENKKNEKPVTRDYIRRVLKKNGF